MTLTPIRGSTCLPRFATPRDLRFPTYGTELGEVARRLGTPLMPWQQSAVDVALEYDPVTGLLRYDEVDITVPRQSGKTTLTLAKKVHRLTVMAKRLGPQRSTYTAQTRLAARKKLERDFANALRTSRSFREVPHARARPTKATEWRLSLNNGSEAIQFGLGNFLQIDAPSRTGGHGDTLDDGTIDEAFSQEDDTVEGAMRPAMATRKNAQLWVISTAGDARSKYLWRKVLAGRAATESGEHGRVCYIEFSAPDDADPGAPATWWGCMPALGITVTEQFIQGEWERAQRKGQEGINTFCRAYLNQWPEIPILSDDARSSVIPVWGDLADSSVEQVERVAYSLEVANGRTSATIGAAWEGPAGPHLTVAKHATGTDWIVSTLTAALAARGGLNVTLDAGTEALSFRDELERAGITVHVTKSADRAAICGRFHDAAMQRRLTHDGQQIVTDAVAGATWRETTEGARVFARKGGVDISPLYALVLAFEGMTAPADPGVYVL